MNDHQDDQAALATVLIDHFRKDSASCGCGWGELGKSHAHHQAEQIIAAGYVKPTPDHDISPGRGYICDTCDRAIEWDNTTQKWNHL